MCTICTCVYSNLGLTTTQLSWQALATMFIVASHCHGVMTPAPAVKSSTCCCCFSPHCVAVPFCNSCCFLFFVALPCTSSGLPFFANIMPSLINNTLLLTTICDLNRVLDVITNKYQWCYVLIFIYRRLSVILDILIMICDGW